ncbi:MAG TPA: hypothetical protein PKW08_12510 [Flavobacteriaceae bacterium]|nr:hypothetical protein [Flavobacteriaceae bacterium]HPF11284.1 hypothetical protein [Flavobacteriaceae bacterium]HQU22402.1 hypothetical protein [Flavobacteriaceae bacterium]HQU64497.1 hypothetical protein [Flavobacteriaceae bacterium]HRW44628.1 hypothetical protein [Flavobacteriaceae bacterium]
MRFILSIGISILLLNTSCTSHTYDDVVDTTPQGNDQPVTFQDVKFVFETICQQCHTNPPQNGAPMPLVTFQNVREAVLTRGLLERISRDESDPGLMPFGGPKLPQNIIDLIFQWEADGLLQNP